MRNKDVLQTVNVGRNILQTLKLGKANLVGHNLRKNSLLKHVSKGMIERRLEVTGRPKKKRDVSS
jgi:hypothetical protein